MIRARAEAEDPTNCAGELGRYCAQLDCEEQDLDDSRPSYTLLVVYFVSRPMLPLMMGLAGLLSGRRKKNAKGKVQQAKTVTSSVASSTAEGSSRSLSVAASTDMSTAVGSRNNTSCNNDTSTTTNNSCTVSVATSSTSS